MRENERQEKKRQSEKDGEQMNLIRRPYAIFALMFVFKCLILNFPCQLRYFSTQFIVSVVVRCSLRTKTVAIRKHTIGIFQSIFILLVCIKSFLTENLAKKTTLNRHHSSDNRKELLLLWTSYDSNKIKFFTMKQSINQISFFIV